MGPGAQASTLPDAANKLPAALCAFPSPASEHVSLESPTLSRTLAGISPTHFSSSPLQFDAIGVMPTPPLAVGSQSVVTPPIDSTTGTDFNMIVGGALAPVHFKPPPGSLPKAGPGLRLPSFKKLGIASPHPDRFAQPSLDGAGALSGPMNLPQPGPKAPDMLPPAQLARQLQDDGRRRVSLAGQGLMTPVQLLVATLTPPAERGEINWGSMATVTSAGMHSPSTDLGLAVSQSEEARGGPGNAPGSMRSRSNAGAAAVSGPADWIDAARSTLLEDMRTAPEPSNPLRVLSHALPSPSPEGHIFPSIISSIHDSTPSSPTVWINVFHAVPGRFNLSNLPTSPPATPGPAIGGEDYFTQKVFDSAVPVSDYQEELSALSRSPRPVVPPRSINVSIVERYIPPTNAREFSDLTNTNGPSILVDRLTELSPSNGSLIFIYPTRPGAQTFMQDYLSPVLDPLLRSMCVIHGLSSDLSGTLGQMSAVKQLPEYDTLERGVRRLCEKLTQRSPANIRIHGKGAHFEMVYATKQEVMLPRVVWADYWWSKQEKPRIRDVVTRYAQEAQKKSSNQYLERSATPTELVQQLLEGVRQKPYQTGQEPTQGVEIAVFVIKRTEREGGP